MQVEFEKWLSEFQWEKFCGSRLGIFVNCGRLIEGIPLPTSYRASRSAGLYSILLFVTSRLKLEKGGLATLRNVRGWFKCYP